MVTKGLIVRLEAKPGMEEELAARRGSRCVASLEAPMACGFGVCLGCAVPRAAGGYDVEQGQHRREPTRDGVDQAQLVAPVRGCEERDVRELEGSGGDDERQRRGLDMPGQRGGQDEHEQKHEERDGGRGFDVALAREQQVPEGVQRGGAERKPQRVERHARDRTIVRCT